MNRTIMRQIAELQEGLDNLKAGKKFVQWDDDTIGSKDCGVENFPFCGGRGYKTLRCPLDKGTTVGQGYHDGCYYRCAVRKATVEMIEEVIDEANAMQEMLQNWGVPDLLDTCGGRERDVVFALNKLRRQQ